MRDKTSSLGVQEFRSSGVQEFRRRVIRGTKLVVQEFRSSRVQEESN
jgi:hypothetical protein